MPARSTHTPEPPPTPKKLPIVEAGHEYSVSRDASGRSHAALDEIDVQVHEPAHLDRTAERDPAITPREVQITERAAAVHYLHGIEDPGAGREVLDVLDLLGPRGGAVRAASPATLSTRRRRACPEWRCRVVAGNAKGGMRFGSAADQIGFAFRPRRTVAPQTAWTPSTRPMDADVGALGEPPAQQRPRSRASPDHLVRMPPGNRSAAQLAVRLRAQKARPV